MTQTLNDVLDGAVSIIKTITPDYRPGITFTEADYRDDLMNTTVTDQRANRLFQVVAGIVEGFGGPQGGSSWNGPLEHHLLDVIVVKVMYHVPRTRDPREVLSRMAATDAQRIYHDLAYATPAQWGGETSHPARIDPQGGATLDPIDETGEGWVMTLPLTVSTFLGE